MLSTRCLELLYKLQSIKEAKSYEAHQGIYPHLLFFVSCLLVWRLWTFTVHPYLRPDTPKELPYSIPYIGEAHLVVRKSHRSYDYTKRTHEVYSITVWGQKLYIVTAPGDVAAAFRNTTCLIFDDYLNDLLVNFGVKGEPLKRLWYEAQPGDPCYLPEGLVYPRQSSVSHLTEEVYRQQLLPGDKMDTMCRVFIQSVNNTLHWNRLEFCTLKSSSESKFVSLQALCRHPMVEAATRSLFGNHLYDFEPDIVKHMLDFNDHVWMILFRYPEIFSSQVSAPRRKLVAALKAFIELPEDQRHNQAWSVKTVLAAQEIIGIDLESKAATMLMILWAANSNEYNISFWVLAYLLFDETLFNAVKAETEAAWPDGMLNIKYLCEHSTTLNTMFCEALRVNGGAMISRKVSKITHIGGTLLQPGNSVIIPSRQLHMNPDVWGNNVEQFDAFRFADRKGLARHSSYRPFGGGATYCPGRVLAKEEVFGFIAILLHRFHIKLANTHGATHGQSFPKLDDSSPALGITGPVKGMDVVVEMSPVVPID